jgi:hypothetical protein
MTWSNTASSTVQADTVVVQGGTGNYTGMFVYSGVPAAGNLIMSVAGSDGTDPYGNTYGPGIISYNPAGHTTAIAMDAGELQLGTGPDFLNAASILAPLFSGGAIQFTTGTGDAMHADGASGTLYAGTPNTGTGVNNSTNLTPVLTLKSADNTSAVDLQLPGSVIATDLSGNPETWHTPTFANGWQAGPTGGTVQPMRYRRDAQDNLVIVGSAHGGTATTLFTLPAGWRPATTQRGAAVNNSGGTAAVCFYEVNSSGAVSISAVNGDTYFQVCVPLGHLS